MATIASTLLLAALVFIPHIHSGLVPGNAVTDEWNVNMRAIDPCEGFAEQTLLEYKGTDISRTGRSTWCLNTTFILHTDIVEETPFNTHVKIIWEDREDVENREEMGGVDMKDMCKEWSKGSPDWDEFFDSFVDPINKKCPIEKGSYRMANLNFDFEKYKAVMKEGIWHVNILYTYGDVKSCYNYEFLVTFKSKE